MDSIPLAELATGFRDATIAKEYAVASWALFVYEYFTTLDQEVTSIWGSRRGYKLKVLWIFNRYTFFMSFTPTLMFSFIPLSPEQCRMFVKFPAAMQIFLNASAGCTLVLRTYALYACEKWILYLLLPIIAIIAAVQGYAVTMGVPAQLPPGLVGCILTGNPADGGRYALYWTGELVFPTLVFGLTVGRILFLRREGVSRGSIMDVLLRDGVIYFAVIFLANLVNVITFVTASGSTGLQQINAPFSEMITAVMICRLILNLRLDGSMDRTNANEIEISELQCATRRGEMGKGKMHMQSGNSEEDSSYFDSQPGSGSISDSEAGGFEWAVEFRSAPGSVLEEEERKQKCAK